jgi:hypothetical protein
VKLGAALIHFVAFNTVAHGMMLDPPFADQAAYRPIAVGA